MTTTTPRPAWFDLDKVVPPELRHQVTPIAESARAILAAVEDFITNAWPQWQQIESHIADAQNGTADKLDGWYDFVRGLIDLDEVLEVIGLVEWALTAMNDGITPDEHAYDTIVKRLEGRSQDEFLGFLQHHIDGDSGARKELEHHIAIRRLPNMLSPADEVTQS